MSHESVKSFGWIRAVFGVAASYDLGLGALFLLAPLYPFELFEVTPPNHLGYVQFPAALLVIFGLMFAAVARDPLANRNLIPYGILLKLSYASAVIGYWAGAGVPGMWKPFAVIDLAMAAAFAAAWVATRPRRQ